MRFYCSGYLGSIYRDPSGYKRLINRIARRLTTLDKKVEYDAIAFRGTSGAAFAFPLSIRLNKPIICVRKSSENSHGSAVEASGVIKTYIIIDDFMQSGGTIKAIIAAIDKEAKNDANKPKCVGIVLCEQRDYDGDKKVFPYKRKDIPVYYWAVR